MTVSSHLPHGVAVMILLAAGCGEPADDVGPTIGENCSPTGEVCDEGLYCDTGGICQAEFELVGTAGWLQSTTPPGTLTVMVHETGWQIKDAEGRFRLPPGPNETVEFPEPVYPQPYELPAPVPNSVIVTAFVYLDEYVAFGQLAVLVDENGRMYSSLTRQPLDTANVWIEHSASY